MEIIYIKTVLFVPGFQETIDSRNYRATIIAIEQKGYRVVFVPINWFRTTIEDWTRELDDDYETHNPRDTILAGFSFGATTAFMSAIHRQPSELWLFSLSSYFAEDLVSPLQKKSWNRMIGKRRMETFSKLNFAHLATVLSCKILLFYGQKELDDWPIMNERALDAKRRLKHSTYVAIPGVGHDVADERYIDAIKERM
jgi:pimeloyl-ACP methyl ester carboxylesterase